MPYEYHRDLTGNDLHDPKGHGSSHLSGGSDPIAGVTTDEKIKISSNDTQANYLYDKLLSGVGLSLNVTGEGTDEQIQISVDTSRIATMDYVNSILAIENTWDYRSGSSALSPAVEGVNIDLISGNLTTIGTITGEDLIANGNIGIGTAAPASFLHVVGDNSKAVASYVNPISGTSISNGYSVAEFVNTDATENNWVKFAFTDAVSGGAAALIAAQFTSHASNYGNLAFSTRGVGNSTTDINVLINSVGNVLIPSDTAVIGLGANALTAPDATIGFDGNSLNIIANAVTAGDDMNLTAGDVNIPGGYLNIEKNQNASTYIQIKNNTAGNAAYVGIYLPTNSSAGGFYCFDDGYADAGYADKFVMKSQPTASALMFEAQAVAGEIQFYTGGHLDANKCLIIDSNKVVWVGNKIIFTQTDGNEYIDSLNDGYMDYGATTQHRFNKQILMNGTERVCFGNTDKYIGSDTVDTIDMDAPDAVRIGCNLELVGNYFVTVNSQTGITGEYNDGVDDTLTTQGGIVYAISTTYDETLMKDVAEIPSTLDKIMNIRPISFKWNTSGLAQFAKPDKKTGTYYGFTGQDIETNLAECYIEKKGKKTYNKNYVSVMMLKAIQELVARVAILEKQ